MDEEQRFQQYKADFLERNHCTPEEFAQAWEALARSKPTAQDFREFAKHWSIPIVTVVGMPMSVAVQFCVHVDFIRILAPNAADARGFLNKKFSENLDSYMHQPMQMLLDTIFGAPTAR